MPLLLTATMYRSCDQRKSFHPRTSIEWHSISHKTSGNQIHLPGKYVFVAQRISLVRCTAARLNACRNKKHTGSGYAAALTVACTTGDRSWVAAARTVGGIRGH